MINRLFSDMVNNVGSNIQDSSSSMQTIIKRLINDSYSDLLRRINFKSINQDYTLSLVSGTKNYVLPSNFGKELSVYDSTNKRYISFISLEEVIELYPERLTTTGTVDKYTIFQNPVRQQPTSSSTLSIVSSSASDTTQTVRVKGIDSNDIELDESVTLTGTSTATTTNSYKEIRSISKSATTVGRITITSNSSAVTNAILAPADLDYKVKIIRFYDTPASALSFIIPYIIRPYPLSNDNDTPILDCADILEAGATARAWRYKRQFAKAVEYDKIFETGIIQLVWDSENQPNQTKSFNVKTYDRDYV